MVADRTRCHRVLSSVVLGLLLLSGCTATSPATSSSVPPTSSPSATTTAPPSAAGTALVVPNSLAGNSTHHTLAVDGEKFSLKIDYWTTADVKSWAVLGRQDLHLAAYLEPGAAAGTGVTDVLVGRFTGTIGLLARHALLSGVVVGGLTDQPGTLPGFLITKSYAYGTTFAADGLTTELLDRWRELAPSTVPTESALRKAGVDGLRIDLRYDLLVRSTGETQWHRRTVVDQLTVPLPSAP